MKICVKMDENSEQQFLCWFCSSLQTGPLQPSKSSPSWCQPRSYVTVLLKSLSRARPPQFCGQSDQHGAAPSPSLPVATAGAAGLACAEEGLGLVPALPSRSCKQQPLAGCCPHPHLRRFEIGSQQQLGSKGNADGGTAEESGSAHWSEQPC